MYCSKCGREYSPDEGSRFCPSCGNRLSSGPFVDEMSGADESEKMAPSPDNSIMPWQERQYSCPWENIEELGFFHALGATLRESLLEPVRFFTSMPRTGGWLHPLLYAIVIGTTGNLAGYVLGSLFEVPFVSQSKLSSGITLFVGILMPVLVCLGTTLWSVILHGSIFLFGARNKPFEATLRIVSYATGPDIFNVIPSLGWIVAAFWKLILVIVGVRQVHNVSTGRAALAVLFPVLLIWGILFAVIFLVMATVAFSTRSL